MPEAFRRGVTADDASGDHRFANATITSHAAPGPEALIRGRSSAEPALEQFQDGCWQGNGPEDRFTALFQTFYDRLSRRKVYILLRK